MKILPIPFKAPMSAAVRSGRKTQTRRALNPQPPGWATFCEQPLMCNALHQWVPSGLWRWSEPDQTPPRPLREWPVDQDGGHYWIRLPYAVGDLLWVREPWVTEAGLDRWSPSKLPDDALIHYLADGPAPEWAGRYRPGMFMTRALSRTTLRVTDVRVQRLQEISEEDAVAEGCPAQTDDELAGMEASGWFRDLWNSINGPDAWGANPWVAAYTFDVILANVDTIKELTR